MPGIATAVEADLQGAHRVRLTFDEVQPSRLVLDHLRRRSLAPVVAEQPGALAAAVLEWGTGWPVRDGSMALRCTPTFIKRTHLAAGLDAENGRALDLNGNGPELGLQLLAGGLSIRAASVTCGVARSTLHDHARRAAA